MSFGLAPTCATVAQNASVRKETAMLIVTSRVSFTSSGMTTSSALLPLAATNMFLILCENIIWRQSHCMKSSTMPLWNGSASITLPWWMVLCLIKTSQQRPGRNHSLEFKQVLWKLLRPTLIIFTTNTFKRSYSKNKIKKKSELIRNEIKYTWTITNFQNILNLSSSLL